jgi:hypothetical protein
VLGGGAVRASSSDGLVSWLGLWNQVANRRISYRSCAGRGPAALHPPQQSFPSDEVPPPHRLFHLWGTDMDCLPSELDCFHAGKDLVMDTKELIWLRSILWVLSVGLIATSLAGCVVAPGHPYHAHYGYW